MKKRIAILCLVLLAGVLTSQAHPLFFPLSQHSMAKQIGPGGEPLERAYTFSHNDVQAISWLKVWRDLSPHFVEWRWFSPGGRFYTRTFGVIPRNDGAAAMWGSCIWSGLQIKDYEVGMMPGTWRVDVIVDYRKVLSEYFTIDGHQQPCC